MSFLPVPIDDGSGFSPRQLAKARRQQADTDLTIYSYGLQARTRAEIDRIDSQATRDAAEAALDEEFGLYDHGMALVNGSAVKVELLRRKVEGVSRANNSRFNRRFGG